jgi:NTP pyrophosphatase (non-canonical NTP hydrolase)
VTTAELREQARSLKEEEGFDLTMEERLAYLASEVCEVAREALKLRGYHPPGVAETEAHEEISRKLGMGIYDVLWNLLDLAGIADLEVAFAKKAALNEDRPWSGAGGGSS